MTHGYARIPTLRSSRSDQIDAGDGEDRTLLLGYTCDRNTWHVYKEGKKLIRAIYCEHILFTHHEFEKAKIHDIIPDKRLYPQACDYEFCRRLQMIGWDLPFAKMMDILLPSTGKRAEDFAITV